MSGRFGRPAFRYASLDSTMRRAAELAREGCAEGTLVTADRQTAGRGRLGRAWLSKAGSGLYLSLVLRPACPPDAAPLLTLAAGLGVKEGLESMAGVACDLRWPNDVLIGARKCCGILVEMETEGQQVSHAVVGVGVNLNHAEFPPDLAEIATSLRIETGRTWRRDDALAAVLAGLEGFYDLHRTRGAEPILEAFQQASSYARGRRVVVEGAAGGDALGVTAGLDSKGMLLLRSDDGAVEPIVAGSVRPAPCTM